MYIFQSAAKTQQPAAPKAHSSAAAFTSLQLTTAVLLDNTHSRLHASAKNIIIIWDGYAEHNGQTVFYPLEYLSKKS